MNFIFFATIKFIEINGSISQNIRLRMLYKIHQYYISFYRFFITDIQNISLELLKSNFPLKFNFNNRD